MSSIKIYHSFQKFDNPLYIEQLKTNIEQTYKNVMFSYVAPRLKSAKLEVDLFTPQNALM